MIGRAFSFTKRSQRESRRWRNRIEAIRTSFRKSWEVGLSTVTLNQIFLSDFFSNQIKLNGDVNIEEKNSGNFHLFDFKTKKSLKENSSSNFALHAGDNNFVVDDELENLIRIRDELFQINRDIERKNNALNLSIHDEREAVVEARTRLRSLYYRHHIDVNHSIL